MRVYSRDINSLLRLAIPLIMVGLMEASISFTSSFFLAHLGEKALAVGGQISWLFAVIMVIMWGVISSISILVPYKDGANDQQGVAMLLRDGLWMTILLSIPMSFVVWHFSTILVWLGQPASLVAMAVPYTHALMWSVLPDFAGLALLQFLIGLGRARTNLIFTLIWVPLNITFNALFVFGHWRVPAFGMAGLGWGMTASYWLTTTGLLVYMLLNKTLKQYWPIMRTRFSFNKMYELFRLGLPQGLMLFVEVGFFFSLTLVMQHYSLTAMVANQLTTQFVGFFVAIPFAVAEAITVRMGYQIGAGRVALANRFAWLGSGLSVMFIIIVALIYWFAPRHLLVLDTNKALSLDSPSVMLAVNFLAVAAVVQLLEALRIALFGALRGLKDTRFPLLTSCLTFGLLALPLGYLLSHRLGAIGYWYGLMLSSIVGCIILIWRYRRQYQAVKLQNSPVGLS